MQELPLNIKKSIGRYDPIETDGLTLYPIKVSNYYEFLAARPSLDFMQQTLPIELMSRPLLDAYFRIDMGLVEGIKPTGLFTQALLMLSMALRLMPNGSMEEQAKRFAVIPDDAVNPTRLKCLRFVVNGEEIHTITPIQFGNLRPIIAAQNGVELYSDTANPELVQAEKDLAEKNAPKLEMSVDALIGSAALITHTDEKDIYDWPILKLHNRLESAKRVIDYIICGIGESQGTKWGGGNPVPHPWFERMRKDKPGVIPLESFSNGQGLDAVRNANQVINT